MKVNLFVVLGCENMGVILPWKILLIKNVLLSAIRRVVEKFSPASLPSVLPDNEKAGFGPIQLQKTALLFDLLNMLDPADVVESENPLSMESVGQVCKHP